MFVICIKSSHVMGMGHLFRMLNLYKEMQATGNQTTFALLGAHTPTENILRQENIGFEVIDESLTDWEKSVIEQYHPTVWINDRLNTTEQHALTIKSFTCKLVTIDDCGSGAKYADLHVSALAEARKEKPEGLNVLTGMDYLILPKDINQCQYVRTNTEKLVVNFGGSDTYGMTVKAVEWLVKNNRKATVILGPGFMHEKALAEVIGEKITIKRSVPSLVAEFSDYDVAITGGGLTAFEAAAAGLPTLTVANELHEIGHCEYLQSLGCSLFAGYHPQANFDLIDKIVDVKKMSQAGMRAVTLSGTENICNTLLNI